MQLLKCWLMVVWKTSTHEHLIWVHLGVFDIVCLIMKESSQLILTLIFWNLFIISIHFCVVSHSLEFRQLSEAARALFQLGQQVLTWRARLHQRMRTESVLRGSAALRPFVSLVGHVCVVIRVRNKLQHFVTPSKCFLPHWRDCLVSSWKPWVVKSVLDCQPLWLLLVKQF